MPTSLTTEQAWDTIKEGNRRFVDGTRRCDPDAESTRRVELVDGQAPFAVVVSCSDSRVPPELVMDQGLGDLFVIRTAGHIIDGTVLGSIEYGVEHVEIPLVVVLGHRSCGAVAASIGATDSHDVPPSFLRDVVEKVSPSIIAARRDKDASVAQIEDEHIRHTCQILTEKSALIAAAVAEGRTAIIGAVYNLDSGEIDEVVPLS